MFNDDTGTLLRYLDDLKRDILANIPEDVIQAHFVSWLLFSEEDCTLLSMRREAMQLANLYKDVRGIYKRLL